MLEINNFAIIFITLKYFLNKKYYRLHTLIDTYLLAYKLQYIIKTFVTVEQVCNCYMSTSYRLIEVTAARV